MLVVAEEDRVIHGETTSRNGQAGHCRRWRASQTAEVVGRPMHQRRLLECPNDTWASRVLSILACVRRSSRRPQSDESHNSIII